MVDIKVVPMALKTGNMDKSKLVTKQLKHLWFSKKQADVIMNRAFGMSFKFGNGIVQNFSKSTAMQINTGNKVVTLTTSLRVLDFIQCGKYASVKFADGQNIKFGYINLEGDRNKIIKETDDYRTIAVKGDMIFEPEDGKINVCDRTTFKKYPKLSVTYAQRSLLYFLTPPV